MNFLLTSIQSGEKYSTADDVVELTEQLNDQTKIVGLCFVGSQKITFDSADHYLLLQKMKGH